MDKNLIKKGEKNQIRSIHSYQEAEIKEIIKKSKNLEPAALEQIAFAMHAAIEENLDSNRQTYQPNITGRILLLHAPSSSFARGQKKRDHMAIILEKIKDMADKSRYENKLSGIYQMDICLHAFIIDVDKRRSQHEKNKMERTADSKSRYKFLCTFDQNFINSYDYIYILDDVRTTGTTLSILMNIIRSANSRVKGLTYCQ